MTSDDVAIRRHFPYLEQVLYLNTAAAGVSSEGEGRAAAEFYRGPMSRGINGMADWQEKAAAVREQLAELLNVPSANVLFLSSTTEALNLTARSIRFSAGDQIVLAEDEFPSVVYPWLSVATANPGVTVAQVPVRREEDREASLLAALTEHTRVVAVSHVHWRTGTAVDLRRLGAACRARDALLVVDGVQAMGAIPVTLGDDVDVYCASVFKWMISGFGLAVWVVSDRALQRMEPAQRGYENPPPEQKLRYSHLNYPGVFALAGSMRLMGDIGWGLIHRRVASLSQALAIGLRTLGYPVVTPETRGGIVSFEVKDAALVCQRLQEQHVFVAERGGLVRASAHFYNTHDEIERFLEIVDALAPVAK